MMPRNISKGSQAVPVALGVTAALLGTLCAAPVARGATNVATTSSPTAHAEPLSTTASPQLETITVYARRLTPVTRVAATVTVVDQARIAATLATDVRELVRYEPGLSVRNDPFRFGLDTFTIRGLGGNRVAVEIDGIPASGGFAVGSYADSGRAFIDTALIERVEFLRGPASSLYGSDAIGGIVAMSTLQPSSLLSRNPAAPYALRSEIGYSGDDQAWHAALAGAGTVGAGRWLAAYVQRTGEELDTAARVEPNPRDYRSQSLLLKYETAEVGGAPLLLTLEGGRLEQDSSVDAFLGLPGRFVNTTLLQGDDVSERYRASLGHTLHNGSTWFDTGDWKVYWQGTQTQQDTLELRQATPPRSPAVQLDRGFSFDEDTYGLEFTALRALRAGNLHHDLVYGIEAARSRLEELRTGLQTTLATGATTTAILGEVFPLRDLPLTDITEVGVFLQDEISPASGRWALIPALRIDYYDLAPGSDGTYREDNPTNEPVALSETSLAPKLGATYRLTESTSVYFQYAHGFRSPPPEDVNIGLEVPLFNVRAIPNPDLQPETSHGFETGLRVSGPVVRFTGSVYYNEYEDFIESKVNLGVDAATGVTLFQSQNISEARIYGAEVGASVDASNWRRKLEGWSARLAASWSRGDDLVRDQPLNSIDPPSAVLGLRYEQPSTGRWGAELVTTAVAAQRDVDRSRADLYRTDGYVTLDLLAHVNLGEQLRLNLGLFNLTDEAYSEWSDVRGRAIGDPLLPYYTRPGFNTSATLHYSF
jgi:hemoglobin/transferrin/lactoferrin receptor protein